LFGWKGITYASKLALSGAFAPPKDIPAHEVAFNLEFHSPDNIKLLSDNEMLISIQDYISFWRKAKETKSCYPDRLSFATMKADACSDLIASIECNLANIPLKSEYSPQHWKHCLDVMI